ncbi:MAG: hypothetical protein M1838_000733 [Thelocarpon superellum]|nr:MAG: hypothetical protein M1838_000733 [Thelocarpon superellum]
MRPFHGTASQTLAPLSLASPADDALICPPHPLRIKPAGNVYTARGNLRAAAGVLHRLPDELLVAVLEHLDAPALLSIGSTCKALYAFAWLDELWKALFIGSITTELSARIWEALLNRGGVIPCDHLFSDALYRPFYCAHTPLDPFVSDVPALQAIPRLSQLSASDFGSTWADSPFILTDVVPTWPLYRTWSITDLLARYGDVRFRAEAVDWPLQQYVEYMEDNRDESPLYLFDKDFVGKMGLTVGEDGGDYWAPECFGEDLFEVLRRKNQRPDWRWLIMGPERSGSTFHKDPNATSAWNAVIRGAKYWIMFPTTKQSPPPPGVFVSEDQSEVTSPLSIAEWLLGFHAEARKTKGCMEGICREGELLHVPSGWWHLVVNLSPSVAITQNFVPRKHLAAALSFLRDKPDQVSGFRSDVVDPYRTFVECMQDHPEMLAEALAEADRASETGKKRKWEAVVRDQGEDDTSRRSEGFTFGFGGDDQDAVDIP